MIQLTEVCKTYQVADQPLHVLRDITTRIPQGGYVAVMGPSGSGKSTLLPGTSADVEVILEIRADVLRLPTSALLQGRRVLIPDDGELVEREIEIGLKNWDYAEVTKGLAEGEIVVVSLDREEVTAGAQVEFEADSAEQ